MAQPLAYLIASLAKLALLNGSLRSLRCSLCAAVFVASDETTLLETQLALARFRRLLLQIGGANIASADRAFELAYFVVARRR